MNPQPGPPGASPLPFAQPQPEPAHAQRVRAVVGPLVTELLAQGQPVALDFPANIPTARDWLRSLAEAAGACPVLHHLDVPDPTCLAHIAARNRERPEGSPPLTPTDFPHSSSFFQPPRREEGPRRGGPRIGRRGLTSELGSGRGQTPL